MNSVDQIFHDVFRLSPEIKLKLVHELWDDLAANPPDVPIDESQIDEAQRRIEQLDRNPESGLTWDQVKRNIRAERRNFPGTSSTAGCANAVAAELVDSPRTSGWKA